MEKDVILFEEELEKIHKKIQPIIDDILINNSMSAFTYFLTQAIISSLTVGIETGQLNEEHIRMVRGKIKLGVRNCIKDKHIKNLISSNCKFNGEII